MTATSKPEPANGFLVDHVDLLRRSLRSWTGGDLVARGFSPEEAARQVFDAPFVVLSHGPGADQSLSTFQVPAPFWGAVAAPFSPARRSDALGDRY